MKIPLIYPKIPNTLDCPLKQCISFAKIDGTNLHFDWSPLNGFHSFGTRRDSFSYDKEGINQFIQAHPELKEVKDTFQSIEKPLNEFLHRSFPNTNEVIIFAEFHGPNSFAGSHFPKDKKELTIFDVQVDRIILPPEQFVSNFSVFNIPEIVFKGKFSGQLFADVRAGKYPVKEGVVVKGMVDGQVYMAKIKTNAYLEKLKSSFKHRWKDYWE